MATAARYRGSWQVAANVPNLTTGMATNQDGDWWIAQTADPAIPEAPPAGLPGLTGGANVANGQGIIWDKAILQYAILAALPVTPGVPSSCYDLCPAPIVTQAPPFWTVPAGP